MARESTSDHPSETDTHSLRVRWADAASSYLRSRFSSAIQRAAENQLLHICEFRGLALDIASVGTWDFDIKKNEVSGDDRACAIFGAKKNRLSFEEVIDASHPEDREKVRAAVEKILQPGSDGKYFLEHRVLWPEGTIRHVGVKGQVFFTDAEHQNPIRFIGTVTDISDRKAAEQALWRTRDDLARLTEDLERTVQERTSKLRETVADMEKFSHALVHDMRAPLRAMESYAFLLREELKSTGSERIRQYLEHISNASKRLDHLILDALNYSHAVRSDLKLNPVNLHKLIEDMIHSYPSFQSPRANVRIIGELPIVIGNIAGLTQCFSNLLANAVKFVKPNTVARVEIYAENLGSRCRIYVRDNGIGIAKECHERIFDLFQRLHNNYEGTGLGLAIVRKVAGQMGGAAGVESEPGTGSRFWIELGVS
jgi:PAS domain S-box-containing protein